MKNTWKRFTASIVAIWSSIIFVSIFLVFCSDTRSQDNWKVQWKDGLQMVVAKEHTQPTLRILLPGAPPSDNSIEVLFPEHVTVRKHGQREAEQLYLFQPGNSGDRPSWKSNGSWLEYEKNFPDSIHLRARATLEEDGVRLEYEFTNRSAEEYDMIYAVTDPRLTAIFHDKRLERTYVHHRDGFELLASETPQRLTMPLDKWLPSRYLVSYTWPVPATLVERRADDILYYNKSRKVDSPFIATLSQDQQWVIASFTPQFDKIGNVWSNPQLTCQHVDPQSSLLPGKQVTLEVKILIFRGSVEDAFTRAMHQRNLKN